MSYFDIQGYEPQWLNGYGPFLAAHGERLRALTGRRLRRAWLLWDLDDDEWFCDAPVLLDFDGEQVEVNHRKFDDLSITWNTIEPHRQPSWEIWPFRLSWRDDALSEFMALHGQQLHTVDFLYWTEKNAPRSRKTNYEPSPVISFGFTDGRATITNGLDENALEFGTTQSNWHRYPVLTDRRSP